MLKPMNVKFWEETCASHENAVLPFSILQQKSPSPQQCSSRPIKNHNPALHVLSQDISKLLEHPQHFSEKQVHLTCLLHCLYSRRPRGGGEDTMGINLPFPAVPHSLFPYLLQTAQLPSSLLFLLQCQLGDTAVNLHS